MIIIFIDLIYDFVFVISEIFRMLYHPFLFAFYFTLLLNIGMLSYILNAYRMPVYSITLKMENEKVRHVFSFGTNLCTCIWIPMQINSVFACSMILYA